MRRYLRYAADAACDDGHAGMERLDEDVRQSLFARREDEYVEGREEPRGVFDVASEEDVVFKIAHRYQCFERLAQFSFADKHQLYFVFCILYFGFRTVQCFDEHVEALVWVQFGDGTDPYVCMLYTTGDSSPFDIRCPRGVIVYRFL